MKPNEEQGCGSRKTIAEMKNDCRPLLLFAPSLEDPRTIQQLHMLHRDDLRERDVVVVLILDSPPTGDRATKEAPGDLSAAAISEEERSRLRTRFHVAAGSFAVVLIGKDGTEKLRRRLPLRNAELNARIDSMPMRKLEMSH